MTPQEEINRLKAWVADLQIGGYINCVYCGHRYGRETETPVAMAAVLKTHILECPKHPMSQLMNTMRQIRDDAWVALQVNDPERLQDWLKIVHRDASAALERAKAL